MAPSMTPRVVKWMSMYLPKREELSLRMVFALPNAAGREDKLLLLNLKVSAVIALRFFQSTTHTQQSSPMQHTRLLRQSAHVHSVKAHLELQAVNDITTLAVGYSTSPSRIGLESRTCLSIHECCPLTAARNWRMSLVDSVFPAPDSPLQGTWWVRLVKCSPCDHYSISLAQMQHL